MFRNVGSLIMEVNCAWSVILETPVARNARAEPDQLGAGTICSTDCSESASLKALLLTRSSGTCAGNEGISLKTILTEVLSHQNLEHWEF